MNVEKEVWYSNPEYVEALSKEEYHNASAVLSAIRRDEEIMKDGLAVGYYIKKMHLSEGYGRFPHLKNTSRVTTMKALEGILMDTAEDLGGDVLKGYKEYVYVNNCRSGAVYLGEPGGVWELNYRYFDYVKDRGLYDFGQCAEGVEDYIEYTDRFYEFYGVYPDLYGDWKFFYGLWSDVFNTVADKYLDDIRRAVKRRLTTPECALAPCETCEAVVDCDRYGYKEKIV